MADGPPMSLPCELRLTKASRSSGTSTSSSPIAGIVSYAPVLDLDEATWQAVLDINLTGVWKDDEGGSARPSIERRGRIRHRHQLRPRFLRLAQT